jgi:valyl-tRNA synthetase
MTQLSPASKWILKQFFDLQKELEKNLQEYQLAHNVEALYRFLWDDFADWYVEYLKTDESQIDFAKELFLQFIFEYGNYSPFQAEVIWKQFFKQKGEFSLTKKPDFKYTLTSDKEYLEFLEIMAIIKKIRSIRGLFGIDLNIFLEIFTDKREFLKYQDFFKLTAKVVIQPIKRENLYNFTVNDKEFSVDILRYLSQNKEQELKRTEKIIKDLDKQIISLQNQLNNPNFLSKAGHAVIAQKQADLKLRQAEKQEQLEKQSFLNS